ncbi:MAG: sorbosone dehydrogenase family protein [Terriglobales bacterium]
MRIADLGLVLGLAPLVLFLQGCGGTTTTSPAAPVGTPRVVLTPVVRGLNSPVDLQQPPDGTGRLFAVEKPGTIRIIQNGVLLASPFLDISSKVDSAPSEMGLLGLAFHPLYAQNRRFFVHYDRRVSGQIQSVLAEYLTSSDPNLADPASERILLVVNQPFENHKGGQLAFGPDGFFYIGLGDGGSEGDPFGNAQNLQTLLGKMLRINVDATTSGAQYATPPDNPFVSGGGLPEIWAYGLRNPWRFSFDRATGRLFAADVGGDAFEEVDIIQRGGNYGWNIMEGAHCFNPPSGCNTTGLVLPIAEYDHSEGNAVIGGYVYAGTAVPALQGTYIFGDLGTGKIWMLRETSPGSWTRTLLLTANAQLSSFGQDQAGEVYVVELGGSVMRLTPQ